MVPGLSADLITPHFLQLNSYYDRNKLLLVHFDDDKYSNVFAHIHMCLIYCV